VPARDAKKDKAAQPVGEVMSSSITGLVAEARQHQGVDGLPETLKPSFGSFLRAYSSEHKLDIVSVVYDVITGPQDSNHKPSALGLTREQLKVEQPQIFALLRTEIHACTIGYFEAGIYYPHLPPHPAQVHDFVFQLLPAEICAATTNLDFLRLLSGVSTVPVDELIAATIRKSSQARGDQYTFLVEAGQALSYLFRDDYDRLLAVLRKVRPK
jgi:hypothetical protein